VLARLEVVALVMPGLHGVSRREYNGCRGAVAERQTLRT
jgi:hypothetical protein